MIIQRNMIQCNMFPGRAGTFKVHIAVASIPKGPGTYSVGWPFARTAVSMVQCPDSNRPSLEPSAYDVGQISLAGSAPLLSGFC